MLQFRLKFLYLLVFCDTIEIKFCAFYQGPTVENWVKRIEVLSLHKRNKYQWANVINKQIQKFQIFWENTCFYKYTHTRYACDYKYRLSIWSDPMGDSPSPDTVSEDSRAWHAHCCVHPLPFIISRGCACWAELGRRDGGFLLSVQFCPRVTSLSSPLAHVSASHWSIIPLSPSDWSNLSDNSDQQRRFF